MQPSFLPWQGFFALVAAADVFVLLDDFQFQRHSFHQRNRLRLADGTETWITVPVTHAGRAADLDAATLVVDAKWRRRLKTTLDQSYGKAAFHASLRPRVDEWIDTEWPSLSELNIAFIELVASVLDLAPEWRRSSEIGSTGERSARALDLLQRVGARTYLAARGALEYMVDDGVFPVDGIDVVFQDFVPVSYAQRRASEFVSHLSIVDALFEVGPARTRELIDAGQRAWIPWRDIAATTDAARVAP
jgi:WbqC-like protein family